MNEASYFFNNLFDQLIVLFKMMIKVKKEVGIIFAIPKTGYKSYNDYLY